MNLLMASIKPLNSSNYFIPFGPFDSKTNSYYDLESQSWIKKTPDTIVYIYNDEDDSHDHHYNPIVADVNKAINSIKKYVSTIFDYTSYKYSQLPLFRNARV